MIRCHACNFLNPAKRKQSLKLVRLAITMALISAKEAVAKPMLNEFIGETDASEETTTRHFARN